MICPGLNDVQTNREMAAERGSREALNPARTQGTQKSNAFFCFRQPGTNETNAQRSLISIDLPRALTDHLSYIIYLMLMHENLSATICVTLHLAVVIDKIESTIILPAALT